jgi:carbon storage regulator
VLILTRKVEQGIVINNDIVVRVLSIDGERVKIGVDAPRSISVLREELLAEVAGENREAATRPSNGTDQLRRLRRPPQQ